MKIKELRKNSKTELEKKKVELYDKLLTSKSNVKTDATVKNTKSTRDLKRNIARINYLLANEIFK
jgi:ribosomal protein L29